MGTGLRRYEFSERLADILGESRRDLRFRVTLLVSGGLVPPGPRGRGSPPATPDYAVNLLIGVMAAPQQAHTVEAVRCYRELQPTAVAANATGPRVVFGPQAKRSEIDESPPLPLVSRQLRFGEALTRLLDLASATETRSTLARELFGVWVSRSFPVAALQLATWSAGRRSIITQRYELPEGARPPAWLDPERGGLADPGLFHNVFLPVSKLIEIGALTTFPEQRRSPMLNLGPKIGGIASLPKLARQSRHRGKWEKLLATLATVQAWTEKVDSRESRLVEVTDFGSNPGNLRMLTYVPRQLPASAPLVVVLHGCTQTAAAYDKGAGWSTLADRHGFALLLPQQHWRNNPLRCFNWFRPEDTVRDSGEPLSIKQMVERMIADYGFDHRRIYATGVSSGGAMTSVLLATYPEVFAGGAIIAGVPYGSANGLQDAFEAIFQGRSQSSSEWGALVRAASPHQGPWPKISVWHGDADTSVKPTNAEEIVKQWTDLHDLGSTPTVEKTVDGHPHRVWQGADGETLIESYTVTGMSHGVPVDPGEQAHQCGTAAPFFNAAGISSTHHIATFWGLTETTLEPAHTVQDSPPSPKPTDSPESPPAAILIRGSKTTPDEDVSAADEIIHEGRVERMGDERDTDTGKTGASPLGIDVHGIISKSLEAAGLLKSGSSGSRTSGTAPLGIDVQKIITTSLEAAGVLREMRNAASSSAGGGGDTMKSEKSNWEGEGWELLANDPGAFRDSAPLYGQVSSGAGCDVGNKVRSVSRQFSLGHRPQLSYVRRLNLNAAVNDYTKASFSVLVDGLPVDEVSAIGMEHTESEWLQRSGIDLTPFADRTVTLTFEVAAHSNVCNEVSAKAWVDRISVRDAVSAS